MSPGLGPTSRTATETIGCDKNANTRLGPWRLLQSSSLFKIGGGLEPAQLQLAAEKVPYFFQMAKWQSKDFMKSYVELK